MGFHTYDVSRADALSEPSRFRFCSAEELLAMVDPAPDATLLDVGSGTGFYTDLLAPRAGRVVALDVQREMHELYAERADGIPENVSPVTAIADDLPLATGAVDAAFSTMTYHEYATERSLAELARVLRPGGRLVTVDWSRRGAGADGPPRDERFALGDAVSALEDAGFRTTEAETRTETFVHVATPR